MGTEEGRGGGLSYRLFRVSRRRPRSEIYGIGDTSVLSVLFRLSLALFPSTFLPLVSTDAVYV